MTTIASTTPYAWPYDGLFAPARAALLVVGSDGAPPPLPAVAALAGPLRAAGGAVVQVTTAPPRRVPAGPAPEVVRHAGHHVTASGIDGFFGSPLDHLLRTLGRDQLLLVGAWLETSVHSTLRSANDRGYECLLVLDACRAHDPALVAGSRSQIEMSGGIFGAVGSSADVLAAISLPERNSA
jgi:nicotinamidase-related amidase